MARTIHLRYEGTCRDCGAFLAAGTKARWYGRGRVYGLQCHDRDGTRHWPTAQELAEHDGLVQQEPQNSDGYVDARCEDFPCCGHAEGDCRQQRDWFKGAEAGSRRTQPVSIKDLATEAGHDLPAVAQVVTADDLGTSDLVALARGLEG